MINKKHSFEFSEKSVRYNGKAMSKFDIEYFLFQIGENFNSDFYSKAQCIDQLYYCLKKKASKDSKFAENLDITRIKIYVDL